MKKYEDCLNIIGYLRHVCRNEDRQKTRSNFLDGPTTKERLCANGGGPLEYSPAPSSSFQKLVPTPAMALKNFQVRVLQQLPRWRQRTIFNEQNK